MKLYKSEEAINFQHRSKFAKELTGVFQKVIDYKNSLDVENNILIKSVIKYVNENLYEDFSKCIFKHTNLKVIKLSLSTQPNLRFAVMPNIGTDDITNEVFYGHTGQNKRKLTPTTAKELENVSNSFSKETGKLGKSKIQVGKYTKPINCQMFFDPYVAFLMHESIHVDMVTFTASELAAIMMHEVGHVLNVVENMGNYYNAIKLNSEALDYFAKYAPNNEKKKYIDNNLKKLVDKKLISEPLGKMIKTSQSKIKDLEEAKKKSLANRVAETLIGIITLLITLNLLTIGRLTFYFLSPKNAIIEVIPDVIKELMRPKGKTSDKLLTSKNYYLNERYSDEFVSRHGYGAELASGLDKIFKVSGLNVGIFITPHMKMLRNSSLFLVILSNLTIGQTDGNGIYETETNRTKRLRQNCLAAFKDASLPAEFIDDYLQQYDSITKTLANKTIRSRAMQGYEAYQDLLRYVAYPTQLVYMISNGRLNNDYKKLMETVEKLSTSELYYKAAKLSQLSR